MLHTCSKTEIPPKPSKNAENIMFIDSFLEAIQEIELIPFVISRKPLIKGAEKALSIPQTIKHRRNHICKSS